MYICPKGRIGGNLVAKQHPLRMWNALDWWDHGRAEWKNLMIRDPLLWCPLLMRSLKDRLAWQWFENHLFLLDVHGRFGRGHNPRRCSTIPPCFYHFRLQIKTATKHQSRNEKMGPKLVGRGCLVGHQKSTLRAWGGEPVCPIFSMCLKLHDFGFRGLERPL